MKAIKYSLLTLAAVTGIANAATISVNFVESTGSSHANQVIAAGTSAGRSGYEAASWNNVYTKSGTQGSLKSNAGTATTASVTWSASGIWGDSSADTAATAGNGNAQMRRGFLGAETTVPIDVTGIEYAQYTLVLYYSGTSSESAKQVTVNGVTHPASTTTGIDSYSNKPGWDDGNTRVITGLSGNLDIDLSSGSAIAGFQIIEEVPEPSSTALLGLGAIGLILRRRK